MVRARPEEEIHEGEGVKGGGVIKKEMKRGKEHNAHRQLATNQYERRVVEKGEDGSQGVGDKQAHRE